MESCLMTFHYYWLEEPMDLASNFLDVKDKSESDWTLQMLLRSYTVKQYFSGVSFPLSNVMWRERLFFIAWELPFSSLSWALDKKAECLLPYSLLVLEVKEPSLFP